LKFVLVSCDFKRCIAEAQTDEFDTGAQPPLLNESIELVYVTSAGLADVAIHVEAIDH
jgi:hypothetical protein